MSSEQNKTIVRRLLEEPWTGNLKVVDELIDRSTSATTRPFPSRCAAPTVSRKTSRPIARPTRTPESPSTNRSPRATKVATRWTGRGKHDGDLMGIGPTGKQVTVSDSPSPPRKRQGDRGVHQLGHVRNDAAA